MLVPVMQVRPVGMGMSDRLMPVPVTVARRSRKPVVRMSVMTVIMTMRMLVLDLVVTVLVLMHLPVFQKQENRQNQNPNGDCMQQTERLR